VVVMGLQPVVNSIFSLQGIDVKSKFRFKLGDKIKKNTIVGRILS